MEAKHFLLVGFAEDGAECGTMILRRFDKLFVADHVYRCRESLIALECFVPFIDGPFQSLTQPFSHRENNVAGIADQKDHLALRKLLENLAKVRVVTRCLLAGADFRNSRSGIEPPGGGLDTEMPALILLAIRSAPSYSSERK